MRGSAFVQRIRDEDFQIPDRKRATFISVSSPKQRLQSSETLTLQMP
jgi:hypothetical protein